MTLLMSMHLIFLHYALTKWDIPSLPRSVPANLLANYPKIYIPVNNN